MKPDCQQTQNQFPDYLTGDLTADTVTAIQAHVATCESCRQELEELTGTWTQLGILAEEQPGPNLRKNFYTMLASYQEALESKPPLKKKFFDFFKIKGLGTQPWFRRPVFQLALGLLILVTGFMTGSLFHFSKQSSREMTLLRQQNQEFRQQLALVYLNQSSPSQRLKGLTWSSQLKNPADETLEALLYTLNHDSNVNVRLSAVDALYLFTGHPLVKQGLLDSLQNQTSPLVQIALIDLIADMREKQAIKSLKELLKNDKLNPAVKERAKASLEYLF
jgi:hypothetical protein